LQTKRFEKKVKEKLLSAFPTKSHFLLCVSGGADSLALLLSIKQLCDESNIWSCSAIHVVHNLRNEQESARELTFVSEICEKYDVDLLIERIDPSQWTHKTGLGIEAQARELRYGIFDQAAKQIDAVAVLTAHHQDDQIETAVMRFIKGSGPRGLKGIPERRGRFFRPFLNISKNEIVEYVQHFEESWIADPSNSDRKFLRNQIRADLIPLIEPIHPKQGILRSIQEASECWDFILKSLEPERWTFDRFGVASADFSWFSSLHSYLRKQEVLALSNRSEHFSGQISRELLHPLENIQMKSGGTIFSGAGFTMRKIKDRIFWFPDVVLEDKKRYSLQINSPGSYDFADSIIIFPGESSYELFENSTVLLRSRLQGDSITLKNHTKLLKKTMNEWGIPDHLRSRIPLIERNSDLIAVLGAAFGGKDIYTAQFEHLAIQVIVR
jgi:tRNA(Ile)-lysidine synthetase-like protein